jgi:hypothetical protein
MILSNVFFKQVALERFIDDIAIEVVERELISKLEKIFSPLQVALMDTKICTTIAGESEETRARRNQLVSQLQTLEAGLFTCKKFTGFRVAGKGTP